MADQREVFTIVENDSTGVGVKLPARVEGDASAAKNGIIGFSFKDASGNVILPQLDSSGRLPVVDGSAGTCLNGTAKVTATGGDDDIVTLTLALTKTYNSIEISASNLHATAWSLVYIDDVGGTPSETVLWQAVTGPGQFGAHINFDCVEFDTIGGTGTQNLVLRGDQLSGANSDMRGYVGVKEL